MPLGYSIVYGKILLEDILSDKRLIGSANIKVTNNNNSNIGYYESDPETGDYCIIVEDDAFSPIFISKEGYLESGVSVSTQNQQYPKTVRYDLTLTKEAIQKHLIGTIYFDYDSYSLSSNMLTEIKKSTDFIPIPSKAKLEIVGYTDDVGTDEYNLNLSRQRAEEVSKVLINLGFNNSKLIINGKGKSTQFPDDSSKNRRVEISLIQ
jgi:outer membrane protein OmpA-like peptidoglycan-associated protein